MGVSLRGNIDQLGEVEEWLPVLDEDIVAPTLIPTTVPSLAQAADARDSIDWSDAPWETLAAALKHRGAQRQGTVPTAAAGADRPRVGAGDGAIAQAYRPRPRHPPHPPPPPLTPFSLLKSLSIVPSSPPPPPLSSPPPPPPPPLPAASKRRRAADTGEDRHTPPPPRPMFATCRSFPRPQPPRRARRPFRLLASAAQHVIGADPGGAGDDHHPHRFFVDLKINTAPPTRRRLCRELARRPQRRRDHRRAEKATRPRATLEARAQRQFQNCRKARH